MKKIFLCLSILLAVSLVACGEKEKENIAPVTNTEVDQVSVVPEENEEKQEETSNEKISSEVTNDGLTTLEEVNNENVVESNNVVSAESFASEVKKSTLENPLSIGDVFMRNAMNRTYVHAKKDDTNAPLYYKITEKIPDEKAWEIIKKLNETSMWKEDEDENSVEWHGVKVLVDYKDFPTDEYGERLMYPSVDVRDLKGLVINTKNAFATAKLERLDNKKSIFNGEIDEVYVVYSVPTGYTEDVLIRFDEQGGYKLGNVPERYEYIRVSVAE